MNRKMIMAHIYKGKYIYKISYKSYFLYKKPLHHSHGFMSLVFL
jgi:hypothetical protein